MSSTLIIYHRNCYDGFTAAWIARQRFPDARFLPLTYGDDTTSLEQECDENALINTDVYILDFSFPYLLMELFYEKTKYLLVLDHHKTAQEACEGLEYCKFDMEQSGCGLTWRHFFPTDEMPIWIQAVEDRDLWRFNFNFTKDIHAYLASLPMTWDSWNRVHKASSSELINGGKSILRYINTYLEKAMEHCYLSDSPFGKVAMLNIPYQNASEAADKMLEKFPSAQFSCGYFQRADGKWQFSLRSRGDFDVSEVAKKFGGGGHKNAAGFEMRNNHPW